MRSAKWAAGLGLGLMGSAGVAVAIYVAYWATDAAAQVDANAEMAKNQTERVAPVRVEVTRAEQRPLTKVLRIPASLSPWETADLHAKASGYVSSVRVDIGDYVEKGDPLVSIDIPEMLDELRQAEAVLAAKRAGVEALEAKVAQAESDVTTARAEVARVAAERELWQITVRRKKELLDAKAIPDQDYDEAHSRLAVAEAEIQSAQARVAGAEALQKAIEADTAVARSEVAVAEANVARLKTLMEYAVVRAPFDGVITARQVDPGDFVRSASDGASPPLLTVADVDPIRLVLEIPEVDAPFVASGTPVEVDVVALDGASVSCTVARTARALKPHTRTMRAEVDLENPDGRFKPGMYAQAEVKLETKAEALVIPSKAVRARGRELSVLIAEAGSGPSDVARAVPVKIGYDDGIWAEILEGLSGDERIIVSSGGVVTAGTPVLQAGEVKPS